jgi:mRNA-degrading endonuclease YafQ of YafQ-DinJ toxin-antitoxin module
VEIVQTNWFKKVYKKLHANQIEGVNAALRTVIATPTIGEQKAGDLSWLRVYKFPLVDKQMLLGYQFDDAGEGTLNFVDLGVHENFYRDLKK